MFIYGKEYKNPNWYILLWISIIRQLSKIAETLENSNEILLANEINHTLNKLAQKEDGCPEPTQNIKLNLKNRQKAIDEQGYGPPDPSQPNEKFWIKKMKMWKVDELSEVKNMLCGNCAAFDITSKTLEGGFKIEKDISSLSSILIINLSKSVWNSPSFINIEFL